MSPIDTQTSPSLAAAAELLFAVEQKRLPLDHGKHEIAHTRRPAAQAALVTAQEAYRAARLEAVQKGAPLPTQEGIERAEQALRTLDEEEAGLADALTKLEPEHARAMNVRRMARKAVLEAERAELQAEMPALDEAVLRRKTVVDKLAGLDDQIRQVGG